MKFENKIPNCAHQNKRFAANSVCSSTMESRAENNDGQGIERNKKNDLAEKITQLQLKLGTKTIRKKKVLMVCLCVCALALG